MHFWEEADVGFGGHEAYKLKDPHKEKTSHNQIQK